MFFQAVLGSALLAFPINRRSLLESLSSSVLIGIEDDTVGNPKFDTSAKLSSKGSLRGVVEPWTTQFPLERYSGGTNCVRITLSYKPVESFFGVKRYLPTRVYKAIIDTGSPYIVVADGMEYASFLSEENSAGWNTPPILDYICALLEPNVPFELKQSRFGPSEDTYGTQKGRIAWKESFVRFRDDSLSEDIVLGVLDAELVKESGGPLIGLIKRSNLVSERCKAQIRPTFLEQLKQREVRSFQIDSPNMLLTLAGGRSLITSNSENIIPLIDLRPLGDIVEHYVCVVGNLKLDDRIFSEESFASDGLLRPIIAVFDTGLTGCVMNTQLAEKLKKQGVDLMSLRSIDVSVPTKASQQNPNKSLHEEHFVHFKADAGNSMFGIIQQGINWFDDQDSCPLVVVLGQTFLSQGSLTIDIDDREATWDA